MSALLSFGSSQNSAGPNNFVWSTNLESLLQCPVCSNALKPPILQCHKGHLVCISCHGNHSNCHFCHYPLFMRNFALENITANLKFPCKYSFYGCNYSHRYSKKRYHEEMCKFLPYVCPYSDKPCNWYGNRYQILNHLTWEHKILTIQNNYVMLHMTDILNPNSVDWAIMQSCFGHQFLITMKKLSGNGQTHFFLLVQLIGSKRHTEKLVCQIQIVGSNLEIMSRTPTILQGSLQSAIDNANYALYINGSNMIHYLTNDNCLHVELIMLTLEL